MKALIPIAVLFACGAEPDAPTLSHFNKPVMFNTPEADAILKSMQIFPKHNPWNEDISSRPVAANSRQMVERIGANKRFAYNLDMSFIIVPADQKKVELKLVGYPDESDKGPFPIPDDA